MSWMLYGANGYTGEMTARLAKQRGMEPVLAGRNEGKVAALARELGFEYRVFCLDDHAEIRRNLRGVEAVVHQAGPFSSTSKPMVDGCLDTGCHYLDITGEISVFESVLTRGEEALKAEVVLMPGVGFDVVPTDCMAALLKRELPDATRLDLAFMSRGGGPSQGTSKTMVESIGEGGAARINGKIQRVPSGWKVRDIPFPSKSRTAASIPWGDVSTAYYSTRIPNITVYMAMPPRAAKMLGALDSLAPILKRRAVRRALNRLIEWRVSGPDPAVRAKAYSEIWGEVRNERGDRVSCTSRTPEGYSLTADSSLRAVERLLAGEVEPGAMTPSMAFGSDYVLTLDGVEVFDIISH